jgi:hypothetical protein
MVFDYDEQNPLGSTYIAEFPENEVAHRTAVLGSVNAEHYAETGPSTPSQDGFHRQVSLPPLDDKPDVVGDAGFVYTKVVGDFTELFYEDEDGTEIQLTSEGSASPDKLPLAGGTLIGPLVIEAASLTVNDADILPTGTALIKLLNTLYLQGRDQAGAQWRDLIGVNASDELELGDSQLGADSRIYVTDKDGLLINYGSTNYIVWNKGNMPLPPLFTQHYVSDPQTLVANAEGSVAHNLGLVPSLWGAVLKCSTEDLGYSVGDLVPVLSATRQQTARGISVWHGATQFGWGVSNTLPRLLEKDDATNSSTITLARWGLVFSAWY